MVRTSSLLLAMLLLSVATPGAHADDAAVARWTKAATAFPEPSADKGFDWAVDFVVQGQTIGSGRLMASVGSDAGKAVWTLEDSIEVQGMKAKMTQVAGRDLTTIHGESHQQGPEEKRTRWKTEGGGVKVHLQKGEASALEGTVSGPVVEGLAAGLLALRLLPADAADYETMSLDDDATSAETLGTPTKVSVKGKQSWSFQGKDRDAFIAAVRHGEATFQIALDPATRDLLAIEFVGQPVALVPKKQETTPKGKIDLSKPATTPQAAAVKIAIGFTTGDAQLIGDGLHWPTLKDADPEAATMSVEEYKRVVVAKLQTLKKAERSAIEPGVLAIVDQLKLEKRADGRVVVQFPASFNGFSLVTGEHGGVWYVVEVPQD